MRELAVMKIRTRISCEQSIIIVGMLALLCAQSCQKNSSTSGSFSSQNRNGASTGNSSDNQEARQGNRVQREGMIFIKGGNFLMGTEDGTSYEAPVHEVVVDSFWMDRHEVTVAEFSMFVAATGYKTDAEKFGWSGAFDLKTGEWKRTKEANWRHPDGPRSEAASNEPVCQVSWNDAAAYAKWAGKRLPTEAEWEYAARGGLAQKKYSWGDDLRPNGKPAANWWQGNFPDHNTGEDGFIGRAPVESFPPNGYGLYDVTGNVWEWCADWYMDDYYVNSGRDNPTGPENGKERVIRGGSWMCAENFCTNYRVAARSQATPDSGLDNLGFRCVS